jgi:ribosomal-protein-alanine N-acetyltransferase
VLDGVELVGGVSLSNVVRGAWHNCTVGYWLAAGATGKGHATRALRLALGFAFVYAELHRVQAAVIPTNTASLAVVRRVGMRLEGRALRYLHIGGRWHDHDIFALTLEDWLDRPTDGQGA